MTNTVSYESIKKIDNLVKVEKVKSIFKLEKIAEAVLPEARLEEFRSVHDVCIDMINGIDATKYKALLKGDQESWKYKIKLVDNFLYEHEYKRRHVDPSSKDITDLYIDPDTIGYDLYIEIINTLYTVYTLLSPFIIDMEMIFAKVNRYVEDAPEDIRELLSHKEFGVEFFNVAKGCRVFEECSKFIILKGVKFLTSFDDNIKYEAISTVINAVNVISAIENSGLLDTVAENAVNIFWENSAGLLGSLFMNHGMGLFGEKTYLVDKCNDAKKLLRELSHPDTIQGIGEFISLEEYQYNKDTLGIIYKCANILYKVPGVDYTRRSFLGTELNEDEQDSIYKYMKDLYTVMKEFYKQANVLKTMKFLDEMQTV